MSIPTTDPHYPTLVPVRIHDLELALGLLEVLPAGTAHADASAVSNLRQVLTIAQQAQRSAAADHPRLDVDEPDHDAANVYAFPVPMHRGGHVTEAKAARSLELKIGDLRSRVLAAIVEDSDRGITDLELEARLELRRPTGGNRRGELVELGLVEAATHPDGTSVTRPGPTDRPCKVWTATDRAIPALEALGYHVAEGRVVDGATGTGSRVVAVYPPTE